MVTNQRCRDHVLYTNCCGTLCMDTRERYQTKQGRQQQKTVLR